MRGVGRKRIVELSLPRRFVRASGARPLSFAWAGQRPRTDIGVSKPRKGTRAASPCRNVANTHSAVNIHPVYRGYVKMQRSPRISFVIPGVDRSLDKRNK